MERALVQQSYLTLPYLTFGADDTLRRHPALKPSGGPIAHSRKAKGYKNLPEALASFISFRSKGQRMLLKSLGDFTF